MSDEADQANDLMEQELQYRLAEARRKAAEDGEGCPTHCMNCEEPLQHKGPRFCDSDCREDYEKRVRHHKATWA